MQRKKEEVRNGILNVAREEFLTKGYEKASIRGIASRVGISHGNIRIYFPSKKNLFDTLVKPAYDYIENALSPDRAKTYLDKNFGDETESFIYQEHYNNLQFVYNNKEVCQLILFCNSNEGKQEIRQKILEVSKYASSSFLQKLKESEGVEISETLTNMIIYSLASLAISYTEAIILYNPNEQEVEDAIQLATNSTKSLIDHIKKK